MTKTAAFGAEQNLALDVLLKMRDDLSRVADHLAKQQDVLDQLSLSTLYRRRALQSHQLRDVKMARAEFPRGHTVEAVSYVITARSQDT